MKPAWFAVLLSFGLAGCDVDPFNAGCRNLTSDYSLCQYEDRTTYLLAKSGDFAEGGGILNGSVTKIGWTSRYIVALRLANFRRDPDGWMKVDIETNTVTGPISEEEVKSLLAGAPLKTPADVWPNLSWW